MNIRKAAAGLLVSTYWLATTLGHLPVSLWLVRRRESELLGTYQISDLLPAFAVLTVSGLLAAQTRRAFAARDRCPSIMAWALWTVGVVLVDRLLLYSFPEYLHYPQYALLAWLIAWMIDPDRSGGRFGPILLCVTLLGIADELLQYIWLTISYSNYLDFNDFLLNLLGAAAGLLLFYGFQPPKARPSAARLAARQAGVGFVAIGAALWVGLSVLHTRAANSATLPWIERELSYGQWIPGVHAGSYFVLPPALGTALLIAVGLLFTALGHAIVRRETE